MNLRHSILPLLFCLTVATVHADKTADIRKSLPTLKGKKLIEAYGNLYMLSLETDDINYQLRCVNDLIAEAHRQGDHFEEGEARVEKITLFYNADLNDSIYDQLPQTLEFLKDTKSWKNYYETWTILIDTYNFSGQSNTALKEVKVMYDDAHQRGDKFGMGMAYYLMGNIYCNMYNNEEAADSYRKGIDMLTKLDSKPQQLVEVFSYYADVLELQGQYETLDQLCDQWSSFLTEYYADKNKESEAANRWGYYYLGRAQADLGLGRLQMASVMLDEVKKRCVSNEGWLYTMWLFYRAELCKKQDMFDEALALNNQRIQLLDANDDKAIQIRVRKQRAEIFEGLGRYREAAHLYNELYLVNDSINAHETKRQLTEMNTLFRVDDLKMQQAEERARQQKLSIIIIATIIVLALSIFIYFRLRSARRLKIAHQKLEATHQELLTAYDQLEETTIAKERIESDLRIARNIQMSMVPQTFPERPDLDIYGSMTPAKEVGGDLYNYLLLDDKLYFALGDVSGKGVPASLFMAQATRLFRTLAAQQMCPAEIATRMNDALSGDDNEQGMFVTMFLGVVNLATGHLSFCNAGHNQPILGTEFIEMIPNAPIGLFPGLEYEGEEIADIRGRQLFIYTDGLNEAENNEKDQFGDDHLLDIMATHSFPSAKETIDYLKAEVEKHREGAEPNDDLTMLCFTVKGV